ncbi:MAG TPA: amidase [Casimicrobiaceae bacterium]|nr:amidase [Casimicrobiaceae bacterium]
MRDAELFRWPLASAAEAIVGGTLSARALAEAQLARVAASDAAIDAWAHLDPLRVRAEAVVCDARKGVGRGLLEGIGIGVKDIIPTIDEPMQLGSPIYAGHRPQRDAACIVRLKRAGGFVFGKTVTTAFAFLDPSKTRNPWNPERTPGGSSAGSAAAVAAGHVGGAIGTQTNGSVIRPAAYCGVVGFKPTKDALPFSGVHVFSDTLDQLGTFTRTVTDAARLAAALAEPGRIAAAPARSETPPRFALLDRFPWTQRNDADARAKLDAAATRLRQHGAEVLAVDFPPSWREANLVHRTVMLFEAARNLGELQERERARLSPKVNAALDEGRAISTDDYKVAMVLRDAAIVSFNEWLDGFDAVICPPAPGPAPEGLGSTGDPSCCTLWSLTGFPALALPIGLAENGMPLGMQLAAASGNDDGLLAAAAWCEARLPFKGLLER